MRKWIAVVVLLALPVGAWMGVKPIRVLAPELVGVSCAKHVCVEEPSLRQEAEQLYEASHEVVAQLGHFKQPPQAIFCSTQRCFKSFGFERAAAKNIGTFGIVVGPRGWRPYYLQHEMIHHLQNERLGILRAWVMTPEWFMEGMAYSLSNDPRPELSEPWESYRLRFNEWYSQIEKDQLWQQAAQL